MATAANRGKVAEKKVKDRLDDLCEKDAHSAFIRLPDARAGSFQATLCDFLYMPRGALHLLEVKEVNHAYRLPHANMGPDQVGRMRVWKLAGATSLVLIYHVPIKLWRGYDVDRFLEREGGSWDLRDTEPTTLEDLLC